MTFQTVLYVIFVAVIWVLYRLTASSSNRRLILLAASYVFYASWGPAFLVVLLFSSAWNYGLGALIRRKPTAGVLAAGISVNVLLLILFRYAGPVFNGVGYYGTLLARIGAPIGVSFYTFQGISYLVDTYRDPESVNPTLAEFFLYMAFWPIVLAGPICRIEEMAPQFRAMADPTGDDIAEGARRFVIGLFFKVFLADLLASGVGPSEGVNTGFDSLAGPYSGVDVWFLAIGYGFQLYLDFAGYSHMAIGAARMFGIKLPENFDSPYLSRTPSEFWTRWHMSLSFWIRDYLFFPIASARQSLVWRNVTLIFAMTIFGLWHGAKMTFMLWGVYQGVLLVAHRLIQLTASKWRREQDLAVPLEALRNFSGWAATFCLIMLGWVLFRANSLVQAESMLRSVVSPHHYFHLALRANFYLQVTYTLVGYFLFELLRSIAKRLPRRSPIVQFGWLASPLAYTVMIIAVIVWIRHATTFVYVQF